METISNLKKRLSYIKNTLNNLDTSIYIKSDPDCIFGSKQYCDSVYYMNIKPDEASEYIQKMHQIHDSIRLITDKLGLKYLLSEIILIKNLAIKSNEVYHYPYFFDLYSLACKVEIYIKKQIKTPNLQQVDPILSKDKYNALKEESSLPEWTKSEKGKELLKKVISDGYVIKDTYKWDCSKRGRKALLAYFIDNASDYLDIRQENDRIPWLLFRFLMNSSDDIDYLKGVVSKYKHPEHPNPEPNGFREIKKILQQIKISS